MYHADSLVEYLLERLERHLVDGHRAVWIVLVIEQVRLGYAVYRGSPVAGLHPYAFGLLVSHALLPRDEAGLIRTLAEHSGDGRIRLSVWTQVMPATVDLYALEWPEVPEVELKLAVTC